MHGGRPSWRVLLTVGGAALALAGAASAGAFALGGGPDRTAARADRPPATTRPAAAPAVPPAPGPAGGLPTGTTTLPVAPTTTVPPPAAPTDLALPGCPPPPYKGPPAAPPWHPAHLVPDGQLPPAPTVPAVRNPPTAIGGKGMWIWEVSATDHGDVNAIVSDAAAAGLRQLWIRVADSKNGFYNAAVLARLVPAAHQRGIAVIGWGFPYLFDPVADARWTEQAISWRAPDGGRLDGWAADVETSSEGVALSPQRVAVYLGEIRRADPGELLVATVFPPTDQQMSKYPFATMAPYVDAYAPMLYWGCTQPVLDVNQALARLRPLGPAVHVIGQAYDMGPYGGRRGAPGADEIDAFMLAARQGGAVGASFWSWQAIDAVEWAAVSRYRW